MSTKKVLPRPVAERFFVSISSPLFADSSRSLERFFSGWLSRQGLGRLACAHENRPYIVPIYFAYEPDHLYGFTTLGQKVEWMHSNPLVCVEVDEVLSHFRWSSVVVVGRYEELPDTLENREIRLQAQLRLEKRALWWQTAYAANQARSGARTADAVFYWI